MNRTMRTMRTMRAMRAMRKTVAALFVLGGFLLFATAPLSAQVESAQVTINGLT